MLTLGKDLWNSLPSLGRSSVLIADQGVAKEYIENLQSKIETPHCILLPGGEKVKTRAFKEKIEDQLIEWGLGREAHLVAVGGGATLDLVGYVASTYCRGVNYTSFPTTLLAMTDAAIGGKTGINVAGLKNWVGAFYSPKAIYADLTSLETLPQEAFIDGLVETIKHALIGDALLFSFLEENLEAVLARDEAILEEMIGRSVAVKQKIVAADPFEKTGERRHLNFGHTVGHALESLSQFGLTHGKAVAKGIAAEVRLASLPPEEEERILRLMTRIGYDLNISTYGWDEVSDRMKMDKKGSHTFVRLAAIGSVKECCVLSLEKDVWTRLSEPIALPIS